MDTVQILKRLCEAQCIYNKSDMIINLVKDIIKPFCDEIRILNDGSFFGAKKSKNSTRKIMIDAHMDEIGLMISEIDEKGFLHFVPVGGVDLKTLPASVVDVFGREMVKGVIGIKPPHLQNKDEVRQPFKCEDLTIDIGYTKKDAEKIVSVGDYACVCGEFTKLSENEYSSKSMDNRAGMCAILKTAEKLSELDFDADIYYVFSCGEEFDMSGANIAANVIKPDICIAVDVTHGITADNKESAYQCGGGPSYSIGPNISKKLVRIIEEVSGDKNINIHPEVDGGSSGTNAWTVQVCNEGVATAVLSIPLKYMHTQVETLDISDIENVVKLLTGFIKKASVM